MNPPIPRPLAGLLVRLWLAALISLSATAAPLGTAFTYQGRLSDGLYPASGTYDFTVHLHAAADSQSPLASATAPATTVTDGIFTLSLDFGAAAFDGSARWIEVQVLKTGESGAPAVLSPRQQISATPYALLAKNIPDGSVSTAKLAEGAVGSAQLSPGSISPDKLAPGAAAQNLMASGQSGVASGGVVLSASAAALDLLAVGYFKVGRTDLIPERWLALGQAPEGTTQVSSSAKAVWTGSVYIVWGGGNNAGARYNPSNNTWSAMTTVGGPTPRTNVPAVWTGTEMIVWGGGRDDYFSSGGRYNPATNTWLAMTNVNAPSARRDHSLTWTDSRMIVWGGGSPVNPNDTLDREAEGTGASYNPSTNQWTTLPQGPARIGHAAVWTGSALIVTGGYDIDRFPSDIQHPNITYSTTSRYTPATNTWETLATIPEAARWNHTAIWTGSQMLIYGGGQLYGGRYDAATNSWPGMAGITERVARTEGTCVWTGSELLIWGGQDDQGAVMQSGLRLNPETGHWSTIGSLGAPTARRSHTAVWTGSRMIIWGGRNNETIFNDGASYNPVTDAWTPISTERGPARREQHRALWTGTEMLIWAGTAGGGFVIQDGGRYNPATNSWRGIRPAGAPSGRFDFTWTWTGQEAVLWGGAYRGTAIAAGGRYNPATDTWQPVSLTNAPPPREGPTAVWSGREVIVWGGGNATDGYPSTNGRYNPATDTWTTLPSPSALFPPRAGHTAVWDGTKMIVWGGAANGILMASGAMYSPELNSWTDIYNGLPFTPPGRFGHFAVWAGSSMAIWGGSDNSTLLKDAAAYTPPGSFYLYLRP